MWKNGGKKKKIIIKPFHHIVFVEVLTDLCHKWKKYNQIKLLIQKAAFFIVYVLGCVLSKCVEEDNLGIKTTLV